MFISSLFPDNFPALALAHFVALLSPGPDFFLLAAYAIRYRLRGSAGICLGIALGNGIYIFLAIIGWAGIQHSPRIFTVIELSGAAYLLWIGYQLLKSRASHALTPAQQAAGRPGFIRQILLGLASALLNPKNILFYISLMTSILGQHVTVGQQIVCGVWMFSIVLIWDLLVAMLIARPRIQRRLQRYLNPIERAAGAILIFFGLILLFHR
ncbi:MULTISPECIES: LysE family translocator [unclassified Brenneria]|uniref:LysE family translocator n=1 Tax=unclassified Brenneria TaxID=2634434 RepID=UPI0029C13662|nr:MULTISPECIES: LysE family translocator [unclassified Brenneria]MDX5627282.1 LysE family translocator [Brenneria sp. L3-3Z]MDX5694562.1 LysE family translocator [Brenneria sp. L4-2C]MEE3661830.1 LysE family translocator [Brenneria sp. g21c3]